jgi:hypothetical protein
MTYFGTRDWHHITKLGEAYYIFMENRALWEISSSDKNKVSLWLDTDEVSIEESYSNIFPYNLVNKTTGDTVSARFVGRFVK